MDISVNNVNFSGKKEILYGLKKASKYAKSFELCENAYSTSRMAMTKYEERAAYSAAIKAYLDMIINDAEFSSTVKNLKKSDLKEIRGILRETDTEHGIIHPLNKIKNGISDIMQTQKISKEKSDFASKLIYMLA